MKKTLKTKVLAGTITVALLSSAGFALADVDAGGQLKTWYEGVFNKTKGEINNEVKAFGNSKLPELQAEFEGMKNDATTDINSTRDDEITRATTAINSAKTKHLSSLDAAKQEVLDEAGLKFYNLFLEGHFEIERLGEQAKTYATGQFRTHTGDIGTEALNKVTTDLNAVKDTAVSDLEAAIVAAQGEIEAEVAIQKEINIRNLKQLIDWKIEDLRGELNGILDGLVLEQQRLIEAKAGELEGQAKTALDGVVSGINN